MSESAISALRYCRVTDFSEEYHKMVTEKALEPVNHLWNGNQVTYLLKKGMIAWKLS